MIESTKALFARPPSVREAVHFALTAALSEGLALGFLDVSLSLGRRPPGALRNLGGALAPVAAAGGAFFFFVLIALLPCALLPARTLGQRKGALLLALAAGAGTFLGLAVFYNVTRLELNAFQARTLVLVLCLSLAIGARQYDRARAVWNDPGVPQGFMAVFLSLPLVLGSGFLLMWSWAYRRAGSPADSPRLWVVAFAITGALLVMAATFLARRVCVERWLGALALLVVGAPMGMWLFNGDGHLPPPAAARTHAVHKVLFLSIDTLRADAVSALNPVAPPTPSLDSLASDSVVFAHAYSPAPWTLPSFVSMMTGVAPPVHGVKSPALRIPDTLTTLAERMRSRPPSDTIPGSGRSTGCRGVSGATIFARAMSTEARSAHVSWRDSSRAGSNRPSPRPKSPDSPAIGSASTPATTFSCGCTISSHTGLTSRPWPTGPGRILRREWVTGSAAPRASAWDRW
ncbi:MAG: hypothetical protein DMF51_01915 [Acidobacteria bacterium]|nr:MAG: hypothetical protein DMF51_01915 [Acidobacteriota bacterium]